MVEYCKKNKYSLIIGLVTTLLLMIVVLMLHTNRTVEITYDVNADGTQGVPRLAKQVSLTEGVYNFEVTYEAVQDVCLNFVYKANRQEFVLSSLVLPASNGTVTNSYTVNVPFSIRNESLDIATSDGFNDICSVKNVGFASVSYNKRGIATIIAYIIVMVTLLILLNEREDISKLVLFCSIVTLFLEPLFLVSITPTVVWVILAGVAALLLKRGKFELSDNVKLFGIFLLFALLLMEFFTSSSPLFPFSTGCDASAYYTVGGALANGRALYTEVFDHKGPVLLFFFMIGYLLSPNYYYGIWLLEAVAVAMDMYFVYKLSGRFVNRKLAIVSAEISAIFLLNQNYLTNGSTLEAFSTPLLLGAFVIVSPYISCSVPGILDGVVKDEATERSKNTLFIKFILLGLLSSIVFWSKFSISIAWMFIAFALWCAAIKRGAVKNALGYILGWMMTTAPIVIYFAITSNIKRLYHYYFKFNTQYGGVESISMTLSRIIKNVYEAMLDNKLAAFMILVGIAVFISSTKLINNLGKTIILGSFIIMCGTAYAGQNSYPYYFTLIAAYSVWGIIAIVNLINNSELLSVKSEVYSSPFVTVGAIVFGLTLFVNNSVNDSILIDREPRQQEVIAQQMEYISPGDKSFFNLGFLDMSFYPASKQYPLVQYFYYPNIPTEVDPEPHSGQISYIQNRTTEFFIWRGFSSDNYPDASVVGDNYEYVTTYRAKDDIFYMLYRRK